MLLFIIGVFLSVAVTLDLFTICLVHSVQKPRLRKNVDSVFSSIYSAAGTEVAVVPKVKLEYLERIASETKEKRD